MVTKIYEINNLNRYNSKTKAISVRLGARKLHKLVITLWNYTVSLSSDECGNERCLR